MSRLLRRWLVACAVSALGVAGPVAAARAQSEAPAAPPAASEFASSTPVRSGAYVLPPPGPIVIPDAPGPDALLDRPEAPQPGWFVNTELHALAVHLRNQPQIGVPTPGVPNSFDTVAFAGNQLDFTVSPRFEVGYRLPEGSGELLAGYRFLATTGSNAVLGGIGPGAVSGRLDFNVFDFQYRSLEFSLAPLWDMRWGLGVRYATLYYDSTLALADVAPAAGDVVFNRETNHFYAVGPFGSLELDRHVCAVPGLSLYGKAEFTNLVARVKQTGAEAVLAGDGTVQGGYARQDDTTAVPTLSLQAGVSYEPGGFNHSRLLAGYEYEVWWQVGRVQSSRGQLDMQGLYLRAELNW